MTRGEAWRAAARIHTLPAAVVPVLVGAGLAISDHAFRLDAFWWAMLGGLAIQVAANFANDVGDAKKGADSRHRLGPKRMVATGVISPRQMWAGVGVAVGIAAISGVALAFIAGPIILVVGVVSLIAMLGYVGGPAPYGYRGLGEVFVFVFFGLVATVVSRYVHDMTASLSSLLLAIPVGLLSSAILVVNNIRDMDTDRVAGKRTLAVILGRTRTRYLYATLIYGSLLLIVVVGSARLTPPATMLAGLLAPYATGPVRIVARHVDGPNLNRALKLTARLHLLVGITLAAGAAVAF